MKNADVNHIPLVGDYADVSARALFVRLQNAGACPHLIFYACKNYSYFDTAVSFDFFSCKNTASFCALAFTADPQSVAHYFSDKREIRWFLVDGAQDGFCNCYTKTTRYISDHLIQTLENTSQDEKNILERNHFPLFSLLDDYENVTVALHDDRISRSLQETLSKHTKYYRSGIHEMKSMLGISGGQMCLFSFLERENPLSLNFVTSWALGEIYNEHTYVYINSNIVSERLITKLPKICISEREKLLLRRYNFPYVDSL